MGIIIRQRTNLTAYEEGRADGDMRRGVLESRSYPYIRDGYQGPQTLSEAIAAERQNVEGLLQEVTTNEHPDPDDIAYLQGKMAIREIVWK